MTVVAKLAERTKKVSLALRFSIAAWATTLSGCTSLTVISPDPLIESPELSGRRNAFELGGGLESSATYTYTTDASRRPPTLDRWESESVSPPALLYGRGGFAIVPWLEIGLKGYAGSLYHLGLENIGPIVRAQVLGLGESPGWKASVYGGLLRSTSGNSGDQNGTFGDGGYKWRARAEARTLTAGASLGYRFEEPKILLFGAVSYGDQRIIGSIDQDRSDNGLDPGATYGLQTVQASSRLASLGLRWGTGVQFAADAGIIFRNWPKNGAGGGGVPESEGRFNLGFIFRAPRERSLPTATPAAAPTEGNHNRAQRARFDIAPSKGATVAAIGP